MSALIYVILKSLKNGLLEILRNPGKLVLWGFLAVLMIAMIVLSLFVKPTDSEALPMFWLSGLLFLLLVLFLVLSLRQGLMGGEAIFAMQDVNLLFSSPVSPRQILLYGILRMTKTAFLATFFIPFQAVNFVRFGIDTGGTFLIFGCFVLAVVIITATSLLVYILTNSRPARKRVVRALMVAVFVPLAAYLVWQYLSCGDPLLAVQATLGTPAMSWVPIAGWTTAALMNIFAGNILAGLAFLGLDLLFGAAIITYIMLSDPDYFEDVLVATETAFEKKRAILEGDINAAMEAQPGRVVKLKRTGISGHGAAAFFGKHMRESFRANRLGFLSLPTAIFIAGAIVLCYFVRDLTTVLQVLMWVQIFMIGVGRGLKELFSHYIYMVPLPSFQKLVWSNMELMAQVVLVACSVFFIGGILIGTNLLVALLCALAFILFSFVLVGINYLSMRFTGTSISQGVMLVIYMIAVLVAVVPGVVLALLVGFGIGGTAGLLAGLLILCGWNLVAGVICFALSSGVLHNCDMPTIKMGK